MDKNAISSDVIPYHRIPSPKVSVNFYINSRPSSSSNISVDSEFFVSEYKIHPTSIDDENMYELQKNEIDMIKNDIRNFRTLPNDKLQYLIQLSEYEKNEILILYNKCMKTLNDIGIDIFN
jgi:hypothetical protein